MNLPLGSGHEKIETISFEIDTGEAIKQLVMSQSSSPAKSILELVMNALDHSATKIDIQYNKEGFIVRDNGIGLNDIKSFQEFCLKQTESKRFGRFRLGRAQVMGLSKVFWRSNTLKLEVDLLGAESNGEAFHFKKYSDLDFVSGTTVEGKWYPKVDVFSSRDLREYLQYVDYADISINGILIVSDANWDYQDEICQIKLKKTYGGTNFYNKGVHIIEHSRHRYFGVNADVNFLESPELNISRNELNEHCPIVKHTYEKLICLSKKAIRKKENLSDEDRKYIIESMFSDMDVRSEYISTPVLKAANAKLLRLRDSLVCNKQWCLVDGSHSIEMYRKAIKMGVAIFTIHELNVVWGVRDLKELHKKINRLVGSFQFKEINFESLRDSLNLTCSLVESKSLTATQKAQRNALQYMSNAMAKRLNVQPRKIKIGLSEDAATCGWTDGVTYIAIDKNVSENFFSSSVGPINLCLIVAHEYTHNSVHTGHDEQFYEKFHDSVIAGVPSSDLIGNAVQSLTSKYASELEASALPFPAYLAHMNNCVHYMLYLKSSKPTKLLVWYLAELNVSWTLKSGRLNIYLPRARNGIHEKGAAFLKRLHVVLNLNSNIEVSRDNYWQNIDVKKALSSHIKNSCGHDNSDDIAEQMSRFFGYRSSRYSYDMLLTKIAVLDCMDVKCVQEEAPRLDRIAHVSLMSFGLDTDVYELIGTRFYTAHTPNSLNKISDSLGLQEELFTLRLKELFADIYSPDDRTRIALKYMNQDMVDKLNI